ncbi:FAD:protein FMN transferase [Rhizobiales bacterium RZME27]|uniref:FAD:protein FMN transferase n=1 Tax=Endobacterium cereale TaxID=2663029 RepID=A0A6A8A7H9_9HYPH|nr:FAD:protein FMN transferase [Endobacterium cereale]MEB2846464.1 FAD:protein FMN transferase [Endobacterium cereale]MQY45787.1 FAD:protein FMN transferase [Endobacterium cereale]
MVETITRRRALRIMAAGAGLPLVLSGTQAFSHPEPLVWRGHALGAPTTLILSHPDRDHAEGLVRQVIAEVSRLEDIFSLYRPASALCELNRAGALAFPPQELVDLLTVCHSVWEETDGLFDPTVQPLWKLYAEYFSRGDANPSGPDRSVLESARELVGLQHVSFNAHRIALSKRGMGVTLNGIAQGYITDRIVALLRGGGVESSLVDMGEVRAIGAKPDGAPWKVGISENQSDTDIDHSVFVINKAVATSSSNGLHFDQARNWGHIISPQGVSTVQRYRRMTVIAPDATRADALSTAFTLMETAAIQKVLAQHPDIEADWAPSNRAN